MDDHHSSLAYQIPIYEYAQKENRNGYTFSNAATEQIKAATFDLLSSVPHELKESNDKFAAIILGSDTTDYEIEQFITSLDYQSLIQNPIFIQAKTNLVEYMECIAKELESKWDDPRYSRELESE